MAINRKHIRKLLCRQYNWANKCVNKCLNNCLNKHLIFFARFKKDCDYVTSGHKEGLLKLGMYEETEHKIVYFRPIIKGDCFYIFSLRGCSLITLVERGDNQELTFINRGKGESQGKANC